MITPPLTFPQLQTFGNQTSLPTTTQWTIPPVSRTSGQPCTFFGGMEVASQGCIKGAIAKPNDPRTGCINGALQNTLNHTAGCVDVKIAPDVNAQPKLRA